MRILLLNTTPICEMFEMFNLNGKYNGSGWVEEVVTFLSRENEVFLACFWPVDEYLEKRNRQTRYAVIPAASADLSKVDDSICKCIKKIYNEFKPEIVHIFGTEHRWTTVALKIFDLNRVIIHITGLVSVYEQHYYGGLEKKDIRNQTLRDVIKGGVVTQKHRFQKWGIDERKSLLTTKYVMGRTTWDKACAFHINNKLYYYHCNEMLRSVFYEKQWRIEHCDRHRIFVSAGNAPYKGVHNVIKAVSLIRKEYPDVKLVVAGNDVTRYESIRDKIALGSYGKYLRTIIKRENLEDAVTFVGAQDVDGMIKHYLKSHVFVLPSMIENSPNSLGEAMLLGMPCVASYVGGVPDLLKDKEEGYLYPYDEPYMLAYYVMQFFSNDEMAVQMGGRARKHAMNTHSREKIGERLIEIYKDIIYRDEQCDIRLD